MDDFGVLVERYGIKTGRNSAPMAASKNNAAKTQRSFNQDPDFFSKPAQTSNSGSGSFFNDDNDDIFGFNSSHKGTNHASTRDVFDDVFQMPTKGSSTSSKEQRGGFDFDMMESMFKNTINLNANSSSNVNVNDDDIWGFSDKGSTNVNVVVGSGDDLLSSDPVDDFWGKLEKVGSDHGKRVQENKVANDDLIPGFGGSKTANGRSQTSLKEKNPAISSVGKLQDFTRRKTDKVANGRGDGFTVKVETRTAVKQNLPETNFFDLDGDGVRQERVEEPNFMFQAEAPDLDSFFSAHTRKSVPVAGTTTMSTKTKEEPDLFSTTTFVKDVKVPPTDFPDDFSSMFGGPAPGVFQEIEGESEERRNLRLARHQRAEARMAQALAEMNQREFKAQQEQEERHRIAEAIDVEMKQWGAGKEGNLRALLSSLQQVLGPEFGWRPVTLTDLITSAQVKVAYKKATLCVHPDKVQQKGASLQQRYIAEKAFDMLKEAYNKFNKEELR